MEGKVLGIPLAIIVLAGAIALVTLPFIVTFHTYEMQKLNKIEGMVFEVNQHVKATPTPTPAVSPVPTPKGKVTVSPATKSGEIK